MKKNMSSADKVVRFIIIAAILVLYFTNIITGILAGALLIFAVLLTITVFIGFCPLYSLFGISTFKNKSRYGTTQN
jgi:Protein of unknown function (DUF2892).